MRKFASLLTVLMLISALAIAQLRTVTGQVKNEKGEPVPFASVKLKGTSRGVSADANGAFSLEIGDAKSPVLVISSQGFQEKDFSVGADNMVDAVLAASGQQLEEVMVTTALGIRRSKNKLPFAAQVVAGEDLNRSRSSNFLGNLSGRVAGLDVKQANTLGGSTNVVLRGNKSITGSNQALFVVDGVPYDNTSLATPDQRTGRGGYDYGNAAADINPDDIESVTVLKGAAASALYGSRGVNGVILITSKKGKKGLGITINSGVTFISVDKKTLPTYQKQYGGGYGQYYEDPSGYFLFRDFDGDGIDDDLVVPTSEDASYGAPFDPAKMVYLWDAFDPSSANFGKPRPWVAAANDPIEYFESPVNFNNSVFIEGGNDKATFKVGYTRNDDEGILPNSKITKDLLATNASLNITDRLSANFALNYSKVKGLGRYGSGYDSKNPMSSFRQWWQVNNDILELKDAYFRTRKNVTWNWADPTDLVPIYWDNPYWVRYESFESDAKNRYFGNVSLNYKVTDWLNLLGRVSYDGSDNFQEERIALGSIDVSQYNRINRNGRDINYDFVASFDKNLTEDINLKALLGGGVRSQYLASIDASTNGGLSIPRVYTLANTLNPLNPPLEFEGRKRIEGAFAGLTFTYRNFITIDGTIRRDKSSTLPKGHEVYYYPSVSGGFIFSSLTPDLKWLSYGKLRANYAEVGGDAPFYSVRNTYTLLPAFGDAAISAVNPTFNNENLKSERTKSYEFGLEMQFLNNRAGFDVSYYSAKTVDQILPIAVSRATGYNSKFVNSGTVENKGWEVSLNGSPVKTKDFSWTAALNWSRNRNKVVALFEDVDNIQLGSFQGGVSINATLGQPFGTIRGKDFVYFGGSDKVSGPRDPANRIVGENGRYLQTAASNLNIGDPNPDWVGGISNTFKYKDISLSFLVDFRQGGDIFSLDQYYGLATGLYPETAGLNDKGNPLRSPIADGGGIIRQGVDKDGKPNTVRVSGTNYGAFGYRYAPAAGFIYDASYVKLREAAITYSLPKTIINKLDPFKGIDFSLVGRNLWIIHKNLPYSDPEDSYGAGNLQGYQGNAYPATRTISFNIKLRF